MLPTHSSAIAGAISEAHTQLSALESTQYIALAVAAAGKPLRTMGLV